MKTSRLITNAVAFALFAAFCIAGLSLTALNLGLQVPLPGQQPFILKADFKSAQGLVQYADVRIAGVLVGHVVGQQAASDGGTLVTIKLDQPLPLRTDTRAVVRPKSLLGEKYVLLVRSPGSSHPYLQSGAVLPQSQTGEAVNIDDVLNNMDAPTRAAMTQSLRQLGVALDGNSANVNQSIGPIDQTVKNLEPLAATGTRRQQQIDRILTDLNIIMQALADEQAQLGDVVDSGNRVMGALAGRDKELAGTITQADVLFKNLDAAFNGLTPYDRQSLEESPSTLAAARQMLSLAGPEVQKLFPELLLGQINYPNDQLEVTDKGAINLALEWISAFSQQDEFGYSFRIASITGCESIESGNSDGYASSPNCNQTSSSPLLTAAPQSPALTPPATGGSTDLPDAIQFLMETNP